MANQAFEHLIKEFIDEKVIGSIAPREPSDDDDDGELNAFDRARLELDPMTVSLGRQLDDCRWAFFTAAPDAYMLYRKTVIATSQAIADRTMAEYEAKEE